MAMFTLEAGDFKNGDVGQVLWDGLHLPPPDGGFFTKPEKIGASDVVECEIATEESVKRIGGTVGWGLAGGLILGPVGLLAGLIAGGRGKAVTFVVRLRDGRKFLATAKKKKTYTKVKAMALKVAMDAEE